MPIMRTNILTYRVSQCKDGEKDGKQFKKRKNALNNTKEIITGVGGSKVSSSVMQISTGNQSENVPLFESAIATPKHNESSNITVKWVTFAYYLMTETPGIDNYLLKIKISQGRVN